MKTLLVAASLLALAPLAHAESFFRAEAGLGAVNYETLDGRWYQQGMPVSTVSAQNVAFTIGATGPIFTRGRYGVDWHADYVFMGRASASCECTPDALYDNIHHKALPGAVDDTAHFTGSGNIQGLVLSVEPYYMIGSVRLASEVGGFFNHYTWNEWVNVNDFQVHRHRWGMALMTGASVGYKDWTLAYRHYFTGREHMHDSLPPLWRDIDVIEVRYKF